MPKIHRNVTVSADVWDKAMKKAKRNHQALSAVLEGWMTEWIDDTTPSTTSSAPESVPAAAAMKRSPSKSSSARTRTAETAGATARSRASGAKPTAASSVADCRHGDGLFLIGGVCSRCGKEVKGGKPRGTAPSSGH